MKRIRINIVNKSNNPTPKYETKHSAGMDVRAYITEDKCNNVDMDKDGEFIYTKIIQPGEYAMIPTGLYLEVPDGYMMNVHARSGLAYKKGIMVTNGVGVIDSDYRGECNVLLYNGGHTPFHISNGDRIAQFVLQEVPQAILLEVDELNDTDRGEGGFGSTGIK
jgi:dUTP pyrophosphatase